MAKKLICLIGLHGTGKTTIGRRLAESEHHVHVSVGDLARMARRGRAPSGVPTRLLASLASHNAGSALSQRSAELLASYLVDLSQIGTVSVDGFPARSEHFALLPVDVELWHFTVSTESVRLERLATRGAETSRQWVNGLESERDKGIGKLMTEAANAGVAIFAVPNDQSADTTVAMCSQRLSSA